jgi:hypothetical protein
VEIIFSSKPAGSGERVEKELLVDGTCITLVRMVGKVTADRSGHKGPLGKSARAARVDDSKRVAF